MTDLEVIINKLSHLKQNKNKTEAEIRVMAEEELRKKEIVASAFCATTEEEEFAKGLLSKYLSQGSIESESDKETLRQLIDQELIAERFKSVLKKQYNTANPAQDMDVVERLDKVVERIGELKKELGLSQQDRQSATWLAEWDKLKRKALAYYETHKGCNIVKCPYCSKLSYQILRTEQLTAEKCNWFKGTDLYNKPLMQLIELNVLTREKVAEIMGVNVLYIDKIYDQIYLKDKANDR